MEKKQKAQIVEELTVKFKDSSYFYIMDAGGLTVEETNGFRRKCFEGGIEYKVYKNTLIQKALEEADIPTDELSQALNGFSGVMFTTEEQASVPAKIVKDFRSNNKKPILKAACIGPDIFLGDDNLSALSSLKSKNELIGEVIGLLQSPAKNVISALSSGGNKLSGILTTLSERAE